MVISKTKNTSKTVFISLNENQKNTCPIDKKYSQRVSIKCETQP